VEYLGNKGTLFIPHMNASSKVLPLIKYDPLYWIVGFDLQIALIVVVVIAVIWFLVYVTTIQQKSA
jgi:hypothetical protein